MQNPAYSLSLLAGLVGVLLLTFADHGGGLLTSLGTVLIVAALLVAGLGKVIDVLGYVREGASDPKDSDG